METGILYIVPTPIGNLKDITLRAIDILKNVDIIAAEDTRTTKKLLSAFDIKTKLTSYHKFNEKEKAHYLIQLLKDGKNIALVSDAGTPVISDPGNVIVNSAISHGIDVQTLPGPTAFVPALVNSGFDLSEFYFLGFFSKKNKDFDKQLKIMKTLTCSIVFYEAPHRLISTLSKIYKANGEYKIYIGRELSKKFETGYRGLISEFVNGEKEINIKGEFVIVLQKEPKQKIIPNEILIQEIRKKINEGYTKKDAIRSISEEFKVSKNKLSEIFYKKSKD